MGRVGGSGSCSGVKGPIAVWVNYFTIYGSAGRKGRRQVVAAVRKK